MSTWLQDLRYAARAIRQAPGFTAAAALTLALGVGANTAIFSVVYGVLMRPLGLADPERLVFAFQTNDAEGMTRAGTSPANFYDWRRESRSFDGLAAWMWDSVTLEGGQQAEEVGSTLMVSGNFFPLLGVEPVAGRALAESDEIPRRRGQVAVISERLWQSRWGGDPAIVGRTVRLDGEAVEIVGVMPADVALPSQPVDLWLPQHFDPEDRSFTRRLIPLGRLRPGVSLAEAQADMDGVSERLKEVYPNFRNWDVELVEVREQLVGATRPALLVAFAAVVLVLLIACANMANLLLARSAVREREIATRRALGAGRRRIVAQVLTESVLLALLGGGLGILLAFAGHRVLLSLAPGILPRLADVQLDAPVLAFAAALTLATGVVFGLAPAFHALGVDLSGALACGSRGAGGRRHARARSLLMVSQIAVAVTLLAGAGLLLRTLLELKRVDPGFRAEGVTAARVYLDDAAYADDEDQRLYFERLLERLRSRPEVRSAAAVTGLPMDPMGIDFSNPYELEGQSFGDDEQRPRADFRLVTPGYFETVGIPLLAGRGFTDRDGPDTPPVVIVNETLARRSWPGENPIGRKITIYFSGRVTYEVVGVAGDVRFGGPAADYRPETYLLHARTPFSAMTVVARGAPAAGAGGAPAAGAGGADLAPVLRREALALDPSQPVHSVVALDQLVAGATAANRFYAALLAVFAAVALLLSGAGIFGVISYWVNRRTREIGVRIALGADRGAVVRLVVGRGLGVTALGIALGLAGALATTRLLAHMLYGVGPADPAVLAGVCGVLGLVAVIASLLPARRASRFEPVDALRVE